MDHDHARRADPDCRTTPGYRTRTAARAHPSRAAGLLRAAVGAGQVYRLPSLNESVTGHDSAELIDLVGAVDPRYGAIDDHLTLGPLVAALPPRQRRILTMRFCEEMTQARIGAEVGISQMQVSRLLREALVQLRAGLRD